MHVASQRLELKFPCQSTRLRRHICEECYNYTAVEKNLALLAGRVACYEMSDNIGIELSEKKEEDSRVGIEGRRIVRKITIRQKG